MATMEGRVALVTGAAGNLGAAAAAALSAAGAKVVLADMREEALKAVSARLPWSAALTIVGADVRTAEGCQRLAGETLSAFGRVDALVNTVGTFQMAPVDGGAAAQWRFLMDLNALSALELTAAVAPAMKAAKYGRIVHTAAGAGLKAFAGASVYSASKAALMRIVEAASEELKHDGIGVNCVLPGTIDTPQNRKDMPDADFSKWVQPEEIAAVMAFLASPAASGVTGAGVPVAGRT